MDFFEEIVNLISLRQEGAYWDFKREWYNEKQKSSLLHDIICMANNLVNRDAYIIIGIDEEDAYSVRDVQNDPNRKNTQMIVTFLRDKKFAGDIRPTVYVESIEMAKGTIDVIVVKNSTNTPFYLKNRFEQVLDSHIYTRVQDTNTAKDSSADIHHVEYLWKKRFGMILSPLDRIKVYLQKPEEWVSVYRNGAAIRKYYRHAPEYTIEEMYDPDNDRTGYELFFLNQIDTSPHWSDINLYYHQTLLDTMPAVGLDGGFYYSPAPVFGFLPIGAGFSDPVYHYFIKDSSQYVVHEFYYRRSNWRECLCYDQFMKCVLVFESERERQEFHKFAKDRWDQKEKYLPNDIQQQFSPISGYDMEKFEKQYLHTQILNKMLDEYRLGAV